ncbi:MAG: RHS repeat-associated core domain-containing protein [Prolixibacteraceae bacterium]
MNHSSDIFVNGSTPAVYSIFRDQLGTITHLKSASDTLEYSYDAYGHRRDKDTWSYTIDDTNALFADRGFTGHEHLSDFGLINMNGRLYDPLVGRFLNPDNFVQQPGNSQSYNRYSYCLNNPLKYTDPSGENWGDLLYAAGMYTAGVLNNLINEKMTLGDAFRNTPITYGTSMDIGSSSPGTYSKYQHPNNFIANAQYQVQLQNWSPDMDMSMHSYIANSSGGYAGAVDEFGKGLNGTTFHGEMKAYYGAGGKVGGELLGEKAFIGVHLMTVERTLSTKAPYESKIMYSGIEAGLGSFSFAYKYNWSRGWMNDVGLGPLKINDGKPNGTIVGGNFYIFGGVGGSFNVNPGHLIKAQSQYDRAIREIWGSSYNAATYKKW